MAEVWVLGGTGRVGHATAATLRNRNIDPVLVGRDPRRLAEAAEGGRTVVAPTIDATVKEIRAQRPAVIINTVGPFIETATPLVRACLAAGSDYLDISNDRGSVAATLALGEAATAAGRTVVAGAGFGVTATESVVVKLSEGRTAAERVRVDMVPSLEMPAGVFGEALAGTVVEGLPGVAGGGRYQARRYRDGRLAPARLAGDGAAARAAR